MSVWFKASAVAAAAALAALGGPLTPAGATTGGNMHFTALSDSYSALIGGPSPLPFTCAGRGTGGTTFSGTGNTVLHNNSNQTGDWSTLTEEGQATLVQSPGDTYSGHLSFWIGLEGNNQNFVVHATLDLQGLDLTTGAPATIHVNFDRTTTPAGTVSASHFDISCT